MSRTLWLSDILLFLTGAALMVVFSTVTSLVQLIAPNEMRGRVMSIYMLAFRGGMPLGSLVSGYLATFIGAPTGHRHQRRPARRRRGVLPGEEPRGARSLTLQIAESQSNVQDCRNGKAPVTSTGRSSLTLGQGQEFTLK